MSERIVKFKGSPLHLVGNSVTIGQTAPEAELIDNELKPVKLGSMKGKTVVLVSVPSLDTPVCDLEARTFNEKATSLDASVEVVVVSMDLPFAQSRWCGAHGVKNLRTLSDYRDAKFGKAFGLLIEELHLLARAVLVIDPQGKIQYQELVEEITSEPNYQAAMEAVKQIVKK